MSKWRRLALEQMPFLKFIINQADNPMAPWIDLEFTLDEAYGKQPKEEDTIRQIYGYARWSFFASGNPDLAEAVACAFYEHLPLDQAVRQDMSSHISEADFEALEGAFEYHLGKDGLTQFREEFLQAKAIG